MSKPIVPYLDHVGRIVERLEAAGIQPILVGGMALVVLGSQRVTRDFDFLINASKEQIEQLTVVLYEEGFELASRIDESGKIIRTIDNQRVAVIRLRLDNPASVYFVHRPSGLRMDFLFDFPLLAKELAVRAKTITVQSHQFLVASQQDLLRLKKLAYRDRRSVADLQDIEFLRKKPRR